MDFMGDISVASVLHLARLVGDSSLVTIVQSVFDFTVILVCLVSLILTTRSLWRGQILRRVSEDKVYHLETKRCCWALE